MHLFFFTTGDPKNDMQIMNIHASLQPLATTKKLHVNFPNGNLLVTKPLLVDNKMLDGRQDVNGFLSVEFSNFTYNSSMIMIDGEGRILWAPPQYKNVSFLLRQGILDTLLFYGYMKENRVQVTMQEYQSFFEFDISFWETCFQRAQNEEFILSLSPQRQDWVLTE